MYLTKEWIINDPRINRKEKLNLFKKDVFSFLIKRTRQEVTK